MKILKGIYNFFKAFVLLAMGRKRILKVTKTSDAVILMQRLLDKGLITPNALSKKMAFQSEKDMRKQVRRANKKGQKITVNDLTKTIKEDPSFIKFCERVGLSLSFFEGLAKSIIAEAKK